MIMGFICASRLDPPHKPQNINTTGAVIICRLNVCGPNPTNWLFVVTRKNDLPGGIPTMQFLTEKSQ